MEVKVPRVQFENVDNLMIQVKAEAIKVSFEVQASPSDVARLMYHRRQRPPMNVTIESPQAQFDLTVTPVDVKTGEIVPDELHKKL